MTLPREGCPTHSQDSQARHTADRWSSQVLDVQWTSYSSGHILFLVKILLPRSRTYSQSSVHTTHKIELGEIQMCDETIKTWWALFHPIINVRQAKRPIWEISIYSTAGPIANDQWWSLPPMALACTAGPYISQYSLSTQLVAEWSATHLCRHFFRKSVRVSELLS
jgi:hypothetical protein